MFPACVVIASIAMLSGISGAAMLSPAIIRGSPLIGVPELAPAAAIGMSGFTEFLRGRTRRDGYIWEGGMGPPHRGPQIRSG